MLEWLIKYWLEALFGGLIALLGLGYRQLAKQIATLPAAYRIKTDQRIMAAPCAGGICRVDVYTTGAWAIRHGSSRSVGVAIWIVIHDLLICVKQKGGKHGIT